MFTFKDKNKIYVTSDLHWHHNKDFVWKARGYSSVQEHDKAIVDTINAFVKPDDILINLGDLCLNTPVNEFDTLLDSINCNAMYLIWGNHPNPHFKNVYKPLVKSILKENYTDESEIYPLQYKNIVYLGHYAEVNLAGHFTVLSHFPLSVWSEVKTGAWMLCGHSHYGFPTSTAENTEGKILDVGWDGHGKPWSITEIEAVMNTKKIVKVDNHH